MSGLDLNSILLPLIAFFGSLSLVSGGFLIIRSMFRFRIAVSQSMNADLEVVKVSRPQQAASETQGHAAEAWRDEIVALE